MTLLELLQLLKKHLALVVALPVACAVAMAVVAYGFMANTYTAETTLYIIAQSDESSTNLSSSLSAAQYITNDVATLVDSNRVAKDAAESLGLEDLSGYDMSVSSQTTNRVITLSVEGSDPEMVARVANAVAASVTEVATDVMKVDAINIVDEATAPLHASGPKRTLYVAVAFLAGLFVAVALVVLLDMLNTKVRSTEELEDLLGVSVIGRMPEMKVSK